MNVVREHITADNEERLVSVSVVAQMLGICERQVWRLVARGVLRQPLRVGRSCRFLMSEVKGYIEKLKQQRDAFVVAA